MLTYEYMRSLRLKLVSVQSHCTDDDAGGGAGGYLLLNYTTYKVMS